MKSLTLQDFTGVKGAQRCRQLGGDAARAVRAGGRQGLRGERAGEAGELSWGPAPCRQRAVPGLLTQACLCLWTRGERV